MWEKMIRRGHSMHVPLTSDSSICCSYHEIKGESGIIFRNCEKSTDGNPQNKIIVCLR